MKKSILTSFITAAILSTGLTASELTTIPNTPEPDLEDVIIYDFGYGGTGCPTDTVNAVITPDKKTISMFFDQYYADSTMSNTGRDRKSCNLGVAVKVPHGLTVALVELDYRGYVDNSAGARSELNASYFFAGEPAGSRLKEIWYDPDFPITEDFFIEDQFEVGTIVWSPCGEDAIIRANTSLRAFQGPNADPAFVQVDTTDTKVSVQYQLQWKTCDEP